jgi:hypothetical protein
MDINEVILSSVARNKEGIITSALQDIRVVKIIYCNYWELRAGNWEQYTLVGTHGIGGGHFESID